MHSYQKRRYRFNSYLLTIFTELCFLQKKKMLWALCSIKKSSQQVVIGLGWARRILQRSIPLKVVHCDFPTKQLSKNCLVSILLKLSPTFDILRQVIAGGCHWVRTLENTCLLCHSCFVILVVTCPFPSSGHFKGTCATNEIERSKKFFTVNGVVIIKFESMSVHGSSCWPKFWPVTPFPQLSLLSPYLHSPFR